MSTDDANPLGSDIFSDVEVGHWADEAIGWAAANGITRGTGEGEFSPERALTRAQAATLLAQAAPPTPRLDIAPPPPRPVPAPVHRRHQTRALGTPTPTPVPTRAWPSRSRVRLWV